MTEDAENTEADHVVLRPERRGKLRSALLVLKVESESGGENTLFGYAKSIAPNGMFIATVNPKQVGRQFMISFELPNTGTKVACSCRVMWSRDYDSNLKNEPGMGIMFLDLLAEYSKEIEGWIEEEGRKNKKTKPRFIADRESKARDEAEAAVAGEAGSPEDADADVEGEGSGEGGGEGGE
ncbi:hypothetical protein MNBD_DELTA01-786 [hydrothermal vent metagenome]|uniref:PilZ domain-containing protein n=1 Tax=hydrothermal vent metagenome TaxID=652676 RepID=A0A3B0QRW1_9ZZZZ